jgi:hypothetical protein
MTTAIQRHPPSVAASAGLPAPRPPGSGGLDTFWTQPGIVARTTSETRAYNARQPASIDRGPERRISIDENDIQYTTRHAADGGFQ